MFTGLTEQIIAGKYYLVDAGYPLKTGYLKPYPETRYHLSDFVRGSRPVQGRHEHFNKAHSSLRGVIERTFGVWKKKMAHFKQNAAVHLQETTLHCPCNNGLT
ncbi:hypothetical protein KSP39_PZI003322 [Platanthera zijinensis]|uniref:DDE Tnp4 domain-containing protein n=1 Tax=Platanthera zijinensis TaxID=2320716 RepID=A0AAP0GCE4_9ASPA